MRGYVHPPEWVPMDDRELEPAAMDVVKSRANMCVIAGPGAGKTELLAQRAGYLLQTGMCRPPQQILALTYKRDAQKEIQDRVRLRVGDELAKRFVSMTYDGFAKSILDRFGSGLPTWFRPDPSYEIANSVYDRAKLLAGVTSVSWRRRSYLDQFFVREIEIPVKSTPADIKEIWKSMLKGGHFSSGLAIPAILTFPMIACLSGYLLRLNPLITRAMRLSYSYVFLDEFQDSTHAQYGLVKACFGGSGSVVTAVGDKKQLIMGWAGAKETIFDEFVADFQADETTLLMNWRSAPRLVELQKLLTKHMTGEVLAIQAAKRWEVNEGICEIWEFRSNQDEAAEMARQIQMWMDQDKLKPRDICVLVRQKVAVIGKPLMTTFNSGQHSLGTIRNEDRYQSMLAEEFSKAVLDLLRLAVQASAAEAAENVSFLLSHLRGLSDDLVDDSVHLQLSQELDRFVVSLRQSLETIEKREDVEAIVESILDFLNEDAFKSAYSQYSQGDYLDKTARSCSELLWEEFERHQEWRRAIDAVLGEFSVPMMTIHKSKGLEYDTVVFLGLEDAEFWGFKNNPSEETNAFFVALSRAKRRVIFTFCDEGRNGDGDNSRVQLRDLYAVMKDSGIVEVRDFRPQAAVVAESVKVKNWWDDIDGEDFDVSELV